jgi:U2-associated protein SR140
MWPRTDAAGPAGAGPVGDMNASRRAKPGGLSGFVAYMRRRDAEAALRELDGASWGGSVLRVGWSKSVSLPARPLYGVCFRVLFHEERILKIVSRAVSTQERPEEPESRHAHEAPRKRSRSRSRDRDRDRDRHGERDRHNRRSRSRSRSPRRRRSRSHSPRRRRSRSHSRSRERDTAGDADEASESFIRAVAGQVRGSEPAYERALVERERANPKYAFLRHDVSRACSVAVADRR